MGLGVSHCPSHRSWPSCSLCRREERPTTSGCSSGLPIEQLFQIGFPMVLAGALAYEVRQRDRLKAQYKGRVSKLQKEIDELRHQATSTGDECQQQTAADCSQPADHLPADLRVVVERLERHEDRRMREQLQLVKNVSRRLERIEDIGCSYFKPRGARCRMERDLFGRIDSGYLHGVVSRKHLCRILECDPFFCGQTSEENGRLRQIYAKHWQTKLKLNKYRAIVCQIKQLADEPSPPGDH